MHLAAQLVEADKAAADDKAAVVAAAAAAELTAAVPGAAAEAQALVPTAAMWLLDSHMQRQKSRRRGAIAAGVGQGGGGDNGDMLAVLGAATRRQLQDPVAASVAAELCGQRHVAAAVDAAMRPLLHNGRGDALQTLEWLLELAAPPPPSQPQRPLCRGYADRLVGAARYLAARLARQCVTNNQIAAAAAGHLGAMLIKACNQKDKGTAAVALGLATHGPLMRALAARAPGDVRTAVYKACLHCHELVVLAMLGHDLEGLGNVLEEEVLAWMDSRPERGAPEPHRVTAIRMLVPVVVERLLVALAEANTKSAATGSGLAPPPPTPQTGPKQPPRLARLLLTASRYRHGMALQELVGFKPFMEVALAQMAEVDDARLALDVASLCRHANVQVGEVLLLGCRPFLDITLERVPAAVGDALRWACARSHVEWVGSTQDGVYSSVTVPASRLPPHRGYPAIVAGLMQTVATRAPTHLGKALQGAAEAGQDELVAALLADESYMAAAVAHDACGLGRALLGIASQQALYGSRDTCVVAILGHDRCMRAVLADAGGQRNIHEAFVLACRAGWGPAVAAMLGRNDLMAHMAANAPEALAQGLARACAQSRTAPIVKMLLDSEAFVDGVTGDAQALPQLADALRAAHALPVSKGWQGRRETVVDLLRGNICVVAALQAWPELPADVAAIMDQ
ncbi:hypothetical protein HYH02_009353 [Chlamydomonas schloesseri]|uniref:Uncharacterized protein n=1 Tax=Chlamydomonas schloesseri TaxID=2026947 RepID=A0A835TGU6_9CHLO|nr:hypothetical protein HYH02_009353 [Chlamydomonas schloesseri]|eukprot:KAG2443283.1 hypothetical protein HYH02_009353 [Chlamydomonas schloesseri]